MTTVNFIFKFLTSEPMKTVYRIGCFLLTDVNVSGHSWQRGLRRALLDHSDSEIVSVIPAWNIRTCVRVFLV
jgi:hypothetical protein